MEHPEKAERYPPGDLAIWIFILAELAYFMGLGQLRGLWQWPVFFIWLFIPGLLIGTAFYLAV